MNEFLLLETGGFLFLETGDKIIYAVAVVSGGRVICETRNGVLSRLEVVPRSIISTRSVV